MCFHSLWRAFLTWELEVLLHALVVLNLCGDWNGCGLPIVAIVTPRKLTRPAENEAEIKGRGRAKDMVRLNK